MQQARVTGTPVPDIRERAHGLRKNLADLLAGNPPSGVEITSGVRAEIGTAVPIYSPVDPSVTQVTYNEAGLPAGTVQLA